jgi:hypothetical protein
VTESRSRRRRRAVGPAGAPAAPEPRLDLAPEREEAATDDAERYRREQPPHHDRGV